MNLLPQNKSECEKIVAVVFDAVAKQNVEYIKPYLSDKFTLAGLSSPIAFKALEQIVNNLGNIKSFNQVEELAGESLILSYDVDYEKYGKRQALFEFDCDNKISRLELLKVAVKTVKVDTSKIVYNTSNVIEIPFTITNNMIIVKAILNGYERDFILDSGSGFTIINSKRIGNDTTENPNDETVLTTAKGVHDETLSGMNITNTDLNFYGICVNRQDMLTHDLSHFERNGRTIFGLIGHDLLSKYDVLYDYSRSTVTLIKPEYFETYRKEKLGKYQIETLPLEWREHIPIVQIKIGNNYYRMGVDCGAGANLFDNSFFDELKSHLKKMRTKSLAGASKSKKEVKQALLKKFYAGTTLYKRTETVFSDITHLNRDKEIKLDGLLGYGFLSKHLTLISNSRNVLLLIKR